MPDEKLYAVAEACACIANYPLTPRRIDEVVIHHTWSPTAAQYQGLSTIKGVRNYHMQVRGWSDNGYHWMLGPNGDVWRCRPMLETGAHVSGRNAHTAGVSFVANFDVEDPTRYGGMDEGLRIIAALLVRYQLGVANIRFHREFADKTCPGAKVSLATVRGQVAALMAPDDSQEPESAPDAPDVSPWAQEAVDWCRREGLMVGYPDGLFHGREPVSREQLAVVLKRFADKEV